MTGAARRAVVLVADDDDDVRSALGDLLAGTLGCERVEARDGIEALAALRAGGIDAVLLDHRMPGLTGAEVVRQLRVEGITTPVVLMTAASDVRRLAEELGLPLWLGKPFGLDQLLDQVERALAVRP